MAAEAVKVIVRCRPMNEREKNLNCKRVVNMDGIRAQCSIVHPNDKKNIKTFTFDGAYFVDSTTEQIYADIGYPLVEGVTEGYNGTIFAYGQTGCGKSFSMQGIQNPTTQRGIIPSKNLRAVAPLVLEIMDARSVIGDQPEGQMEDHITIAREDTRS